MAGTMTVAQAIEALFLQAVGTATGTTDAFNSLNGAINPSANVPSPLAAMSGASGLAGVGASTVQTLQSFAGSSSEAAELVADVATKAGYLGLAANVMILGYQAVAAPGGVQNNSLFSTLGSALAVAAMRTPEGATATAVALAVAAGGFLMAGVATNDESKFANSIASFRNLVNTYYNSLSASNQAIFSSAFTTNTQMVMNGGMMLPQIDASGQIVGYYADLPTSVIPQSDGSTLYTFSSGITYSQGGPTQIGPLQESANTGENVWTIPQAAQGGPVKLGIFGDGSYSNVFGDSSGSDVAEVYVSGSSQKYSISQQENFQFIQDVGSRNQIIVKPGESGGANVNTSIQGAAGDFLGLTGNGYTVNTVSASGSQVQFGAHSSGSVFGSGNVVGVMGSGVSLATTGNTINFGGTGYTTSISGGNDVINGMAGDFFGLTGVGYVVNLVNASGSQVQFGANSSGSVSGSGNVVGVMGSGVSLATSGNTVNFGGTGYYTSISGGNDVINGMAGDFFGLTGVGYAVNLVSASGSQVQFGANSSGSVSGSGNVVGVMGSGVNLATSGNTVNFGGTGYNTSISGGNDVINGMAGDFFGLSGVGYAVNLVSASGSQVQFGANSSGSVSGSGNVVGVMGSGVNLATSGNTVNFGGTGYNTSISGGNDVINGMAGDFFGLTGVGYAVNLVNASGSQVQFGANSSGSVSGSGNVVGVMGSGVSLATTGNTINFGGAGYSTSIAGGNNTINMASGSAANISSGSGDIVNGNNEILNITGNNQTIWLSGQYDVVTVTGAGVTVYAQNSQVNMVGAAANNDSNHIVGYGNTGTGWTQGDAYQALVGVPHAVGAPPPPSLPVFSDPSAGAPGSGGNNDGGVDVYPVPNPPDLNPIPIGGPPASDPIILSLDDRAVQTMALASSSVYFDMLNEGQKVQTAWGTVGEGYLVYDPNDRSNATVVTQDSQLVGGFGALQSLAQQVDGTGHGTLTASDALWNSLKVWVDTTGTGQFESGQLRSLDQLGITSINLDGAQVNQNSHGNQILVDSTFTHADGTSGDIAGVNLLYNPNATANQVDHQVRSLISAMASYGAPAASTTSATPVHQDNLAMLAASSH